MTAPVAGRKNRNALLQVRHRQTYKLRGLKAQRNVRLQNVGDGESECPAHAPLVHVRQTKTAVRKDFDRENSGPRCTSLSFTAHLNPSPRGCEPPVTRHTPVSLQLRRTARLRVAPQYVRAHGRNRKKRQFYGSLCTGDWISLRPRGTGRAQRRRRMYSPHLATGRWRSGGCVKRGRATSPSSRRARWLRWRPSRSWTRRTGRRCRGRRTTERTTARRPRRRRRQRGNLLTTRTRRRRP